MFLKRLYTRIWLAVVLAVAVLTFLVGWAWRLTVEPPLRDVVIRNEAGQIIGNGHSRRRRPPGAGIGAHPQGEPQAQAPSFGLQSQSGSGPEFVVLMLDGQIVHMQLPRGPRSPWNLAPYGFFWTLTLVALAVALAVAAGTFLDAIRLDARGGLLGSYVQRNAMIVAFGMSFAVIPLIFTIADDALSSVPDHLRSASLGAGATPWQTAIRVILPAATSGIFSAVMIGLGRAVGETMIVLMAAGNTPIMDWNLFSGFQTLSAAIATELPEAARDSAHYRVLFLAALTLFALTFVLNTVAEIIRERFRRRSHEL